MKHNKNQKHARGVIALTSVVALLGLYTSHRINNLQQEMSSLGDSHLSAVSTSQFACNHEQKTCINANPEDFSYDGDTNSISRSCVSRDGEKINCS